MNFTAIDFETANQKRASACSLGITVVRRNRIQNEWYSLINPQTKFRWQNVKINGIHAKTVADAPTFPEFWTVIRPLFRPNQLTVAHNANFDNQVLCDSFERYQIRKPRYLTLDTLKATRKLYPALTNDRLPTVCRYLGISLHHHNALSDSVACARILVREDRQFGDSALKPLVRIIN